MLHAGALEAFACRACRVIEWYATTLDDVKPDGKDVVELEADSSEIPELGPYR